MSELNVELYKKLYLVRKSEEKIKEHYLEDEMKTPMHMTMGGEAISAGVCHALSHEDQVVGTYRSHGIYLAKTLETDGFFAEMYGKVTGVAKGKGGSMHLTAPEHGLICTSAIVGSHIPVAAGVAYANKMKKNGKRVTVFFGDGAIDEGVFWETVNSACLMKLPLLFVCEDNDYAVHIPAEQRHGYKSIVEIIDKFDCTVFHSDSTDIEEIYTITKEALALLDKGQGPCFLYFKYYRYLEHVGVFEDFKAGYRPKDIFEQWKQKDPVELQRKKLLKYVSEEEITAMENKIDEQVEASIKKAKNDPFPERKVAYEDVLQ